MIFDEVNNPENLMAFMDKNIKYGVVKRDGKTLTDNPETYHEFQAACMTDWQLRSCEEIIKSGVGYCYDQVEVEREWFEKNNYQVKTFWMAAFPEDIAASAITHSFLVYKDKETGKSNIFEHADSQNKGIIAFDTIREALEYRYKKQIELAVQQSGLDHKYTVNLSEFPKPKLGLNMSEYCNFVLNANNYQKDQSNDSRTI